MPVSFRTLKIRSPCSHDMFPWEHLCEAKHLDNTSVAYHNTFPNLFVYGYFVNLVLFLKP